MNKRMVVAGFAILIFAPVAGARGAGFSGSLTNPNLVYVNLGAGVPLSDVDLTDQGEGESKVGSAGFAGTGGYTRMLDDRFGVGAEIGGFVSGHKTTEELLRRLDVKVNASSLVFLATGRVNIPMIAAPNLQPYAMAGVGFHNTTFSLQPQADAPPLYDSSGTGFALALGGGMDVLLTSTFFVGGQVRWEYLSPVSMDPNRAYRGLDSTDVGNSNFSFFATGGIKF